MKHGTTKRLEKLQVVFGSVPIPIEVRKEAFENVRKTSVLPEEERLAAKVIDTSDATPVPTSHQESRTIDAD